MGLLRQLEGEWVRGIATTSKPNPYPRANTVILHPLPQKARSSNLPEKLQVL